MSIAALDGDALLFKGVEWDFGTIRRAYEAIEEIAIGELGLNVYPNRIEVISAEQMLDAYSSTGMPLFYKHWSFGKHFAQHETLYRKGMRGLAYEIVINSSPCISYIMEENTATMQALVIAHAAFGHNHFFRNNYLFKQWTDAEGILDYLEFAKGYVAQCEDRYGQVAVERVLDATHALMSHGVHRYPRRKIPDLRSEQKRELERREHGERMYNDLWRTVPGKEKQAPDLTDVQRRRALLELPQENILYFLEKVAPRLAPWQREILRIGRQVAQYFYPQSQTKLMNEGCATWVHYYIMNRLHEKGMLGDGAMMEFLHSHTSVVRQPDFDDPYYGGLNPYALGFAMMQDIVRICEQPTDEDREWFPDIAGSGSGIAVLREVWANYRDESFVSQFLSPHLIRKFGLFHVADDADDPKLRVAAIHDERGYRRIRQALSRQYDVAHLDPDIQVVDVDLGGDRRLILHHRVLNKVLLDEGDTRQVVQHLADLWGYDVVLREVDATTETVLKEHVASSRHVFG
ncbi:SpoVR family protein [Roseomonas sp. NAR14]|uniref:SpoVR family protein n=1 Tax=Roseomonas acroporae TaxID=2937791 RepID=A0A9X2BW84_9PROT|nr:SpoVR family protein [Roseomonas acroporae]MCK8783600.1 SpoVR family protein [Roseomonas acroporae]